MTIAGTMNLHAGSPPAYVGSGSIEILLRKRHTCHCDERSESGPCVRAIPASDRVGDCFAALAVTVSEYSNSIIEVWLPPNQIQFLLEGQTP